VKHKFVIDVGVGKSVEDFLTEKGHKVTIIRSINPSLEDEKILNLAVKLKSIVVTMDKDFGELVYKSNKPHKGVLLLKLEDESAAEKLRIIRYILEKFSNEIEGKFCVYQQGRFRIRE
jgi:predicted nuclease of predicted toxin-antitoxin system